jgi:hypothetical protein
MLSIDPRRTILRETSQGKSGARCPGFHDRCHIPPVGAQIPVAYNVALVSTGSTSGMAIPPPRRPASARRLQFHTAAGWSDQERDAE